MTESWLKEHIFDATVLLDNYYILRHDRTFAPHGGICAFIHKSLVAVCFDSSKTLKGHPEFMLIEIRPTHNTKVLIIIVYRPPSIPFLSDIVEAYGNVTHLYSDVIILGDFNANMATRSYDYNFIRNFISSHDLYLVLSNPTHHTIHTNSYTWLDLIIVDDLSKVSNFTQSGTPFLSGHELITFEYACICRPVANYSFTFRNFKNFKNVDFLATLNALLIENTAGHANCNSYITRVNNLLRLSLDIHAPFKTYQSKRPPSP